MENKNKPVILWISIICTLACFRPCYALPETSEIRSAIQDEGMDQPDFDALASESIAQASPSPAFSSGVNSDIDRITIAILKKEIALQRFNLRYRLNLATRGKWKAWRYFLSQQAGTALVTAGLIIPVDERMQHINSVQQLHRHTLIKGNILGMTGQFIALYGAVCEFGINIWDECKAKKQGFSQGIARAHITGLKREIDQLLEKRKELVAAEKQDPAMSNRVKVDELEGAILKDIRDLALNEFCHFHMGKTRTLAFQQMLYLMDMSKHSTGAVGNIFGWKALYKRDRRYNQEAGVLILVSGALTVFTPVVSRLVGLLAREIDKKYLKEINADSKDCTAEVLDRDVEALRTLVRQTGIQESSQDALMRAGLYDSASVCIRKQLNLNAREVQAGNLAATENIMAGGIVGGTKVANGILFSIAGYKYAGSAYHTNVFLGSGATVNLVGASIGLLDNVRIQLVREWRTRKQREKGILPTQILNDRLKHLDEIEGLIDKL